MLTIHLIDQFTPLMVYGMGFTLSYFDYYSTELIALI